MRVTIYPTDLAALVFGIDIIGISRIGKHPKPIAVEHVFPARVSNAAGILRVAHPRTVVLQPAVNAIRIVVIDADMIKLGDRQVFALPPFAAAVIRVPHSAVVSHKHHLRVGWVDPHVVRIAVCSLKTAYHGKTFASVLADNQ